MIFSSCSDERVSYTHDIKPLINKRCIACHGGVKRSGGFSLLFREEALDTTESGSPAIIPGDAEHSELMRRLVAHDPEERMPYREEPLSEEEIDLLRRWIDEGAEWGTHWAFSPPRMPEWKSGVLAGLWPFGDAEKSPIDIFIDAELERQERDPAPQADPATLIRRASLDLTGLPPSPEAVARYVADPSKEAWAAAVDTLLASPAFGEKWASWWLDLARYSDTKGYEKDGSRNIWRYRDWVIRAFNQDMPFDRFTIEQLAGDLLPDATDEQYVATAFHRNTMTNDEGGTDDEEFRVASVIDRVNTTFQTWQSVTFGCVQCHSHPYDPFRHEEYYKVMAFFNNTRDEDTEGDFPKLREYGEADHQELKSILDWVKAHDPGQENDVRLFLKTLEPKIHPHRCDRFVNGSLMDNKWIGIRHGGHCRTAAVDLADKEQILFNYWTSTPGGRMEIRLDAPDGPVLVRSGLPVTKGNQAIALPIDRRVLGDSTVRDLYWRFYNPSIPADRAVCGVEWFVFRKGAVHRDADLSERFLKLVNAQPLQTPVMVENSGEFHRNTHVFVRGNRLVHGPRVDPSVPVLFPQLDPKEKADRLAFAKWLVHADNPLTARTMVNRLWDQLFGQGLVTTLEDFGTQGEAPSHPELLDYLAVRFSRDHAWSVKAVLKEIMLSEAYRRDSRVTDDGDPSNRWLSRGPRVRLSAEQLRDQALSVSGLLSTRMYGPSVMPWQPDRVWQTVYSGEYWQTSSGENRNRRAVYTFLKRTSPYPSVMMFDGSSREVCVVQRVRTNTPLQALVTLNDPVFTESAVHLAGSVKGSGALDRIRSMYRRVLYRPCPDDKLLKLGDLYTEAYRRYSADRVAAARFLDCRTDDPREAALGVVALAILNLDEVLMKE